MSKLFPALAASFALLGLSTAASANPPATPVEHPAPKPDDGHQGGEHPAEGTAHPTGH